MPRYFIQVAYIGTNYAGFQIQQNANTIQAEVEKALHTYLRSPIHLTGSSRTDAGVHALQNFFHFDTNTITNEISFFKKAIYHLNAILPADIVINEIYPVSENAHCRFDAITRSYQYCIYQHKDPFLQDIAFFYPYPLNLSELKQAAMILLEYKNFKSFAKKHHQAHTTICNLITSNWHINNKCFIYNVSANRFLRGMVRGLVGTMLKVGTGKYSIQTFRDIIESENQSKTDFSTPAHGLTLMKVSY